MSSQNVVARVRKGHVTWHNGGATTPHKTAPEAMALATPPRGPNPRVSEGYGMSTPRATHPCHGVR